MTRSSFGLEATGTGGTRVIRATGRLVAGAGAGCTVRAVAAALGDAERVVMDLRDVTAIDAGGVGWLLALRRALARHGARLSISAAGPRVQRVLALTTLGAIFGIASGGAPPRGYAGEATPPVLLCRCA